MDVRCGSCNKLFRVADEKIAGKGIKFKCSRCSEVITVTKEAFEQDRAARAAAAQPSLPPAPSKPTMPEPRPAPAPAPEEQLAPQQTPPPAALVDFDFSEPHTAAQQPEEPFGSTDFSFPAPSMPSPEPESESQPEVSPEIQIPPTPQSKPEPRVATKPEPKPPMAPKLQPAPAAAPEEEVDLGKALAIPMTPEIEVEMPKPAPEPLKAAPPVKEKVVAGQKPALPLQEHIHPFASGNATGIAGGLGCALPVLAFMLLGFGMVVKFVPLLSNMPVYFFVAVAGAGIVGFGVLVGLFIAYVQARAEKKLFFLLNILLGALFGAGVGALQSGLVSLARGSGLNLIQLAGSGVGSGITAFFISVAVVIARRIMVSTKEETRSASLSDAQKAGLALSFAVILFAVYGQWALTGKIEKAATDVAGRLQETVTAEGLQIQNPYGYIDERTRDLVITGTVENTTDKEKTGWYLVADVNNDQNAVVVRAKMLNGKQLYARRDYEILAGRGVNVNEIKARMLFDQGTTVPPRGNVNFELRVMEPPVGIANFFVTLQPYDPIKVSQEIAEEMQRP